jgi:hypothetical protein
MLLFEAESGGDDMKRWRMGRRSNIEDRRGEAPGRAAAEG